MNALELADFYEPQSSQVAAMLRKQDAAIRQLREALEAIRRMSYDNSAQANVCEHALAATEEFAK